MLHHIKKILNYLPKLCSGSCLLCSAQSHPSIDLCEACDKELPYLHNACTRCALPLKEAHQLCPNCLEKPLPSNYHAFAPFMYKFPISQLIIGLKFKQRFVISTVLGQLMIRHMKKVYKNRPMPSIIIPIPLHNTRLKQRGFNQALELARPISKGLSIPLEYRSCHRVQLTQPQATLSSKERASNLEGAFAVTRSFEGVSVCLIDDVYTTGSTATALSKTLFEAGARSIDVWCCARTIIQ